MVNACGHGVRPIRGIGESGRLQERLRYKRTAERNLWI